MDNGNIEIPKDDLIKEGLSLLDDALCRFDVIKDCDKSSWITTVLYHLITMAYALYGMKK
jgi:hypothetical protein